MSIADFLPKKFEEFVELSNANLKQPTDPNMKKTLRKVNRIIDKLVVTDVMTGLTEDYQKKRKVDETRDICDVIGYSYDYIRDAVLNDETVTFSARKRILTRSNSDLDDQLEERKVFYDVNFELIDNYNDDIADHILINDTIDDIDVNSVVF
jgi:hypothetical protein